MKSPEHTLPEKLNLIAIVSSISKRPIMAKSENRHRLAEKS